MEEENNVCVECGYRGPEGPGENACPNCGGEMVSTEELGKEETEEELDEEEF